VRPGWRPLATVPDSDQLVCPWQNYSRYTPTGHGEADFQPTKIGNAGFVGSRVDVLATTRDAVGKFEVDTHPGTVACEAEALRKALGAQLKTVSARQLPSPNVSAWFSARCSSLEPWATAGEAGATSAAPMTTMTPRPSMALHQTRQKPAISGATPWPDFGGSELKVLFTRSR
jgi:hypothetical protein